ncbi:MAG TPA: hypothetical protein VER14_04955 [Phototrophicaceae bacterium]|nr:hypothetical protein [Phototrophicaceae bacterium]
MTKDAEINGFEFYGKMRYLDGDAKSSFMSAFECPAEDNQGKMLPTNAVPFTQTSIG